MEKFVFDVISQTLTITAKFAKMMNDPQSDEYKLVQQFRKDFPNLTIAKKTHKSATHYTTKSGEKFNCNQFKNLTYDRMEKFIKALPKSESYLREYTFVKDFASAIQTNGYQPQHQELHLLLRLQARAEDVRPERVCSGMV